MLLLATELRKDMRGVDSIVIILILCVEESR
jgi:hypothetical protein